MSKITLAYTKVLSIVKKNVFPDRYVLGYFCTWTGTQWKCGCRASACTQSYWQLQKVQR
jgi:hypothetical protein